MGNVKLLYLFQKRKNVNKKSFPTKEILRDIVENFIASLSLRHFMIDDHNKVAVTEFTNTAHKKIKKTLMII